MPAAMLAPTTTNVRRIRGAVTGIVRLATPPCSLTWTAIAPSFLRGPERSSGSRSASEGRLAQCARPTPDRRSTGALYRTREALTLRSGDRDTSPIVMTPTGLDEGTLRALAANCGHAYLAGARATGRPWIEDEDLVMSDLGLPIPLSANNATLLRPPSGPNDGAGVASRTERFFTGPGGGYQVWSLWPVDLEPFGFSRSTSPCMVRDPGGERRPPPPELDAVE